MGLLCLSNAIIKFSLTCLFFLFLAACAASLAVNTINLVLEVAPKNTFSKSQRTFLAYAINKYSAHSPRWVTESECDREGESERGWASMTAIDRRSLCSVSLLARCPLLAKFTDTFVNFMLARRPICRIAIIMNYMQAWQQLHLMLLLLLLRLLLLLLLQQLVAHPSVNYQQDVNFFNSFANFGTHFQHTSSPPVLLRRPPLFSPWTDDRCWHRIWPRTVCLILLENFWRQLDTATATARAPALGLLSKSYFMAIIIT